MKIEFLGTADSGGIPVHNCQCDACESYRKKGVENLANSAYIRYEGGIILLDAGIESLSSLFDGEKIKAVLLTHFHPDHALGLLRLRYSEGDKIPCYHPKDEEGFADLFKHQKAISYIQNRPFESFNISNFTITPIPLVHSKNTTGYLIEHPDITIAYLSDCAGIKKESLQFLKEQSIDHLFIDAAFSPDFTNKNHLNFLQASDYIDIIAPKNGYLFHTCHQTVNYLMQSNTKLKYPYIDKGFTIVF